MNATSPQHEGALHSRRGFHIVDARSASPRDRKLERPWGGCLLSTLTLPEKSRFRISTLPEALAALDGSHPYCFLTSCSSCLNPEILIHHKTVTLRLHKHLSHQKDVLRTTFELALVDAEKDVDCHKTW